MPSLFDASRDCGDAPARQGFWSASGVVLRRREDPHEGFRLLAFLKGTGLCWVNAPWAARGRRRFGAATEPLSWGEYRFYQSPRRTTLQDARLVDSYLSLHRDAESFREALEACLWLSRLPLGIPGDEVLGLFWSHFRALTLPLARPPLRVRFLYRWLRVQGSAPELRRCFRCGEPLRGSVAWGRWGLECCAGRAEVPPDFLQDLCRAAMLAREPFVEWVKTRYPGGLSPSDRARWKEAEGWLQGFFPEGRSLFQKGEGS